ncbi:MAG: ADP-ribosylglycohydrolase family protein [Methylococcales bacterium]|nr:ADP-ribosylglycohydrolase family protein [Methylococcales bacterium]
MLGAIAGDVIGSCFEWHATKKTDFELFNDESHFTDDTVLTIAVAYSLLENISYAESLKHFGNKYDASYNAGFYTWLNSASLEPYDSWGNDSAMRVSPIAYAFDSVEEVLENAKKSAEVTHNHPEAIKGAQAVALAIFLARTGATKEVIRDEISTRFSYNLDRTLDEIRPTYAFEVSCQKSVPESILCFFEAYDYEETIRNAVSLGGDSDTMACIAGSIAEAYYNGVPEDIAHNTLEKLPAEFITILDRFYDTYNINL